MADYRISGVWKDKNKVITHYAVHTVGEKSTSRAVKKTKNQAIALVETSGTTVKTWVWNYTKSHWTIGEDIHVVNGTNGKYLRSDKDKKITDNLDHLIDFDWIAP
jgi:hypothetical protein